MKNIKDRLLKMNVMKNISIILGVLLGFLILSLLIDLEVINRYITGILILICIFIIMAVSLNVATGFLGQLVLGHAGFMAVGAYTAALTGIALRDSISSDLLLFIVSALVAIIASGIVGIIVGFPALRLRGDYLGIMTLGFGEIVKVILTNMKDVTGGAQGLTGIPRIMNFEIAYFAAVFVVVVVWLFMHSRHGRAILSIREDEIASESVGINVTMFKLLGFTIAAGLGGLGGAVFAFKDGFLAPTSFGFVKSVDIFVIVVLGGMGSITGSIVAAVFLTSLPEFLREFESYRMLVYSFLLMITMLFRPQGLMGTKEFNLNFLNKPFRSIENRFKDRSDDDVYTRS